MFTPRRRSTITGAAIGTAELIYHNTVRSVRKTNGNAFVALFVNLLQSILMAIIFYFIFVVLSLRGMTIRGDFMLFVLSGIFLFMTHVKTVGAVAGSEGPASPMMQHLPMNTAIAIASAALGALYIQVLSVILILSVYHLGWGPITIYRPVSAVGMLILAWFSGVAGGLVLLALTPWFPPVVMVIKTIYQRANMFASGKMFVANMMPASMIAMFDWNPLFHIIDQSRGFVFINYVPKNSNIAYPIYVSLALLAIGLMGEFYTRKHASLSWSARR